MKIDLLFAFNVISKCDFKIRPTYCLLLYDNVRTHKILLITCDIIIKDDH